MSWITVKKTVHAFGCPPSLKAVVCGHHLETVSLTDNKTLKWLSSLPILMQKSFWWRQCTVVLGIVSFFTHLLGFWPS